MSDTGKTQLNKEMMKEIVATMERIKDEQEHLKESVKVVSESSGYSKSQVKAAAKLYIDGNRIEKDTAHNDIMDLYDEVFA